MEQIPLKRLVKYGMNLMNGPYPLQDQKKHKGNGSRKDKSGRSKNSRQPIVCQFTQNIHGRPGVVIVMVILDLSKSMQPPESTH